MGIYLISTSFGIGPLAHMQCEHIHLVGLKLEIVVNNSHNELTARIEQ